MEQKTREFKITKGSLTDRGSKSSKIHDPFDTIKEFVNPKYLEKVEASFLNFRKLEKKKKPRKVANFTSIREVDQKLLKFLDLGDHKQPQ